MYHSTFWHYPKASHIHIPSATSVNLLKWGNKTASYKSTAAVVTQMCISLQARPDSNMAEFFIHENAREPPALSDKGKLKTGTKSQILGCLPSMPKYGNEPTPKQASVVILDMGAVIHMVRPTHHTMDMLWEKFQWILPLYMKPIGFQSKASVVCSVTTAVVIHFCLKKLNVFSQHICQKTNEYLNSAEQIPRNWNVDHVSVLITSWDIT